MNKTEEIKKILQKSKEGVKITSNGVCNFIEYPVSNEEVAQQICQLFEPKFNNALEADAHNWDTRELPKPEFLPTEDEIKEWIARTMGHLNPEYKPYLLMGVEALYVHLGGNKFLEVNYDKPKS